MEPITIVTVVPEGDGFRLDHPAEDLWIAYEVVRRHVDADGVRHYAQLTGAKMTADGYEFTFDTGDVFSCANATDFPTSETVSDASGGGGSGGVLAVHDVDGTLDKTWREIINAVASTGAAIVWEHEGTVIATHIITSCVADPFTNKLMVIVADINRNYAADSESDYPVGHDQPQDSPILA